MKVHAIFFCLLASVLCIAWPAEAAPITSGVATVHDHSILIGLQQGAIFGPGIVEEPSSSAGNLIGNLQPSGSAGPVHLSVHNVGEAAIRITWAGTTSFDVPAGWSGGIRFPPLEQNQYISWHRLDAGQIRFAWCAR